MALSKETPYQVSVDGAEYEDFRSPWDESELDQVVAMLRNESEERAGVGRLGEVGAEIGAALKNVSAFVQEVRPDVDDLTVYWSLDYPELARVPWELAAWWREPREHILLTPGISFVRTVPMFDPGSQVAWPTGVNRSLAVLYAWGQADGEVPNDEHRSALTTACEANGVELVDVEVQTAAQLQQLYAERSYDFVHLLAHGAALPEGAWGVQLSGEIASGRQIARALRQGEAMPALVTLAACDSANETGAGFSSVAYELHAHGVPMVLASQFRLRKSVSNLSVGRVYDGVLAGTHPLDVLAGMRGQLSPQNNEAWANEVLYTKYTLEELDRGAGVARQQCALRKARKVARRFAQAPPDEAARVDAVTELRTQIERLEELAADGFDPAETYGLLGSLERRIAYLNAGDQGPDDESLRAARDFYERGLRADLNSHHCGVNALHLSWLIGEADKVAELQVIVQWAAQAAMDRPNPDFWAFATAGEAKVYVGDADAAAEHYRQFVSANHLGNDADHERENLASALRQLTQFQARVSTLPNSDATTAVLAAAAHATEILDSAVQRL